MDNLFSVSILSMTGLSILFATVLAIADKKLRVEEDPLIQEVTELLPGVNCGACGCLGCRDFAEHVVKDGTNPAKCPVMAEEQRNKVCKLAGIDEGSAVTILPLIKCAAGWEKKKVKGEYSGVKTCAGANLVFGGGMECSFGCIGYGDCVTVCPFDAIYMHEGLPVIDVDKCTGCGQCAKACPRAVISMQEKQFDKLYFVACNSKNTLLRTREVCSVGCIACGVCVKMTDKGFFAIENNLSIADYSKQDNTEEIEAVQAKCPTKVIRDI
jgi:H+/Na+-translocating ferredoxin:NAD+ oxidoreductase subunit B